MILQVQRIDSSDNSSPVLRGQVDLPASKSYSIRAFIISACGGISNIKNPSDCDDAKVALAVAKQLGASISMSGRRGLQNYFHIHANKNPKDFRQINVRESGTVLRFLLPLLALKGKPVIVAGQGTLIGRPNKHLLNTLRSQGIKIEGTGEKESVPIHFQGGVLTGGSIAIDGTLSSQYISSLLIACPQLKQDTDLKIKGGKLVSGDYISMTIAVLQKAGIKINQLSLSHYHIAGNQKFSGLKNFEVPSDYGLAAFLMAGACLVPSDIALDGIFNDNLIQADGQILEFLTAMGAIWQRRGTSLKFKGPFSLRGGNFSLKSCPDLVPIMAVMALFAKGTTRLTDIGHARAKESDRISDLGCELAKVGARFKESPNELTIYPLEHAKENVMLNPHHDHRLAMAFAVLGLRIGVRIQDIECVKKSYPHFVRDFRKLKAKVHYLDA